MQKTSLIIAATVVAALGSTALVASAKGRHDGPRIDLTEMDTNNDGQITQAEVTAFHAARFAETDANSDGAISQDEFTAMVEARFDGDIPERAQNRIARMFERLDADNSGGITMEEQNADERTARMFERLDADDDGAISTEELEQARDHRGKGGKGGKGKKGPRGGDNATNEG